jgi:GT2 family glycosyltransferase
MHTCFPPGTVVIRKSAFVSIGGFDPNFRCAEDWQFWLRLFHAGYKFVDCPEPLFLCRHHDSNASLDALHVLDEDRLIYQRQIAPHIPWWTRWIHHARVWSGLESTAAYALRRTGNPRHLELMARSIARWPFDDPHRFKVLAHMLYMRLRSLLQRSSSAAFSTK